MDDALPLHNRPVFSCRDPDRTRAYMAAKEFGLELPPREAKEFDFLSNVAYLPGSYLGYIRYGAAATIRVPDVRARDDYWIHLPVRGASQITNSAGSAVCKAGQAICSSPVGHLTQSQTASSRLTFSVTRATMVRQLEALLGEAAGRTLEFAPILDLEAPAGRQLARRVALVLEDFNEPGAPVSNPLLLNTYEQLLITGLLMSQPSTYSDMLQRLGTKAAPGSVKRAIDFIEAHLHLPVTLADISAASGVPGRTLLQHFKDHRGMSPMRYLRDARFARVRDALMRAEGRSITQVASEFGFAHLGRFAVDYRERFGETPSQTYRRRRER
jgi:AraC-like DNA-binding protein